MNYIKERLETIRQLFNSGIMQSADVLSKIINKQVYIKIPKIYLLPIDKAFKVMGKPDEKVISIYTKVRKEIKTGVLLMMSEDSAKHIVKLGTKSNLPKNSSRFFGILEEFANILISYFLNTLSNCLRKRIIPDVPDFAFDMKGAILDSIFAEHKNEDLEVLLIAADIYCENNLKISFIIVPEDCTIEELFKQTCI